MFQSTIPPQEPFEERKEKDENVYEYSLDDAWHYAEECPYCRSGMIYPWSDCPVCGFEYRNLKYM